MSSDINRRALLLGSGAAAAALCAPALAASGALNPVRRRILLGEGHLLLALALLLDDPVDHLVGWQGDMSIRNPTLYEAYVASHPLLADIPVLGQASADTFSTEAAIATAPDLAILSGGYGPNSNDRDLVSRLEAIGTEVISVDFTEDPLNNTAPGLRRLGAAIGEAAQSRAEAFALLQERRVAEIAAAVKTRQTDGPTVLVEAHAGMPGWPCCWVPGGGGLGGFLTLAGARHIGAELAPGRSWLQLQREALLKTSPDIYITTGGPYLSAGQGLEIGPGIDQNRAQTALKQAYDTSATYIKGDETAGTVHGIWHQFHTLPINLLALETMFDWLNPDLADNSKGRLTQLRLNAEFLSMPVEGCLSVSL